MSSNYSEIPCFLAKFAEKQVINNVLPFWQARALSPNGGLYGAVSEHGDADKSAPVGAILFARTLWSFSHAYENTGNVDYLTTAKGLFSTFKNNFVDEQYGGVYWSTDADGSPLETHKHSVAQAYALFAVSLFYQISEDSDALKLAQHLTSFTQTYFLRLDGTYLSQLSRDLEGHYHEQNALIETCNQLHMLEAVTQYIKSTQDMALKAHLEELVDMFLLRIFPAQDHLALRFTQNWKPSGNETSYGHNFEAGYLVYLACETLGDDIRLAKVQNQLLRLVDFTVEHCKHASGSYKYGIDIKGSALKTLLWWPQTEASNALLLAAKLTHKQTYIDELKALWVAIEKHWIDHQHGEWFSALNFKLEPAGIKNKVDFWRCSYHTTRACFHFARENQKENIQSTTRLITPSIG